MANNRLYLALGITLGILVVALLVSVVIIAAKPVIKKHQEAEVAAVISRISGTSGSAQSLSADFTYTVESVKHGQSVSGHVDMMKPNFARFTYTSIARPAYPMPVAADGKTIYIFAPKSRGNYDPILAAQQASGTEPGGGIFKTQPDRPDGSNIHLWDSILFQSFFSPAAGLQYLYCRSYDELTFQGKKEIDGVNCSVLYHHLKGGNISGGENSDFDQWLYVGEDGIIRKYVLKFTSKGEPGTQTATLSNIQTDSPLAANTFVFTPPAGSKFWQPANTNQ
jgi:outer membrane lipoprotein-sorting protein